MNSSKIEKFAVLLATLQAVTNPLGRKPTPFTTGTGTDTNYPLARAAYIRRLHHFKLLTAVDQGCPCIDPIAETKRHIGSVRRTLWLFLHECLPDFPGKQRDLADLLATHNANLLMQGIEKIILRELAGNHVTDAVFAATVLDDARMMDFANRWFSRNKGHRAL